MPSFIYSQDTGDIFDSGSPANRPFATGYSGYGPHKNVPASEGIQDLGPIPHGKWTISPMADVLLGNGTTLRSALKLDPNPGTNDYGRTGFYIHGDNIHVPGYASEGCIVLDLVHRTAISQAVVGGMDQLDVRPHFG